MEKNTKILLGVGAVIAAYLILKPKKVDGKTNLGTTALTTPINNWDEFICQDGYILSVGQKGTPIYDVNQKMEGFDFFNFGTCSLYDGETFIKEEDAKPNPNFGKVIKDGVLVEIDCNNLDKATLDLFAQANTGYRGGIAPSRETEIYYAKLRGEADKKIKDLGLKKCFNIWLKGEQKKENHLALPQ